VTWALPPITESVFLEGSSLTLDLLHQLHALGIRIALDDFDTGYTSLSYLRSFPLDKINSRPLTTDGVRKLLQDQRHDGTQSSDGGGFVGWSSAPAAAPIFEPKRASAAVECGNKSDNYAVKSAAWLDIALHYHRCHQAERASPRYIAASSAGNRCFLCGSSPHRRRQHRNVRRDRSSAWRR
jgi:hypothetical protein